MLSSLLRHPLECKSYSKSCKSSFYYKAWLSRHAKNVAFSDGTFQGWLQSKGHCWKVRAKGFWLVVSCDCPCMCMEFTHFQLPLPSSEVCTTDQCGKAMIWGNMNHQHELMDRSLCSRNPVTFISIAVNPGPNLKQQGNYSLDIFQIFPDKAVYETLACLTAWTLRGHCIHSVFQHCILPMEISSHSKKT